MQAVRDKFQVPCVKECHEIAFQDLLESYARWNIGGKLSGEARGGRFIFFRLYDFDKYYYHKHIDGLGFPSYNPKYDHHPGSHRKLH